jgi:flagellar biosynthesis protein FlhB
MLSDIKVSQVDGLWTVTIGSVMPDWKKLELIEKFRKEFKSSTIVEHGSGVNISGEATINIHF